MMVMRERSGRSGRRRGSQKPGTAIGSDVMAGVFGSPGDALEGGRARLPRRLRMRSRGRNEQRNNGACDRHAATCRISTSHPMALPRNRGEHIIAVAAG